MITIADWGFNKQSACFKNNKDKVNEIYEMYFKKISYSIPRVINGEIIEDYEEKEKYAYTVKEITEKFHITEHELRFLLRQHPESKKTHCPYCEEGYFFKFRNGSGSFSCGHERICGFEGCKNPVTRLGCDKCAEKINQSYQRAWEAKEMQYSSLHPYDLICDEEYILCIKNDDLHTMCKIKLLLIRHIEEYNDKSCRFYIDGTNDYYYTWVNRKTLIQNINQLISELREQYT